MKPEELGAWQALLQEEFEKPYWQTLSERVGHGLRRVGGLSAAQRRCLLLSGSRRRRRYRAVILGQDPYHEPGRPTGCRSP